MKLSEIKNILPSTQALNFLLPNGQVVPEHFHITEVGIIDRHFIDCGGTVRAEKKVNFQLWSANDQEHRLKPQKLLAIISLAEKILGIEDAAIEVEYQTDTIGKYGLAFNGQDFLLLPLQTDCLAEEQCGVPTKQKLQLADLPTAAACCTPGGGCC